MSDIVLTQLVGRKDIVGKAKRFSAKMECNILSGVTYMVNGRPLIFEKFSDDCREMIFRTTEYLQDGIGRRRIIKAPLRNSEYPDISIKDLHGRTINVEYSDKDIAVDEGSEFYVNEVIYRFIQDAEIDVVREGKLFRMDYMMGDDRIKLFPIMRGHDTVNSDPENDSISSSLENEIVLSLSDAFQMIKHGEF